MAKLIQEANASDRYKMIVALRDFKNVYNTINTLWSKKIDLDDYPSSGLFYPFKRSFDELEIPEWVDAVIDDLENDAVFN